MPKSPSEILEYRNDREVEEKRIERFTKGLSTRLLGGKGCDVIKILVLNGNLSLPHAAIIALRAQGVSINKTAAIVGVNRSTVVDTQRKMRDVVDSLRLINIVQASTHMPAVIATMGKRATKEDDARGVDAAKLLNDIVSPKHAAQFEVNIGGDVVGGDKKTVALDTAKYDGKSADEIREMIAEKRKVVELPRAPNPDG